MAAATTIPVATPSYETTTRDDRKVSVSNFYAGFRTLDIPPHFFIFFSKASSIGSLARAEFESARFTTDIRRSTGLVQLCIGATRPTTIESHPLTMKYASQDILTLKK
jgi:hypothetical protein